MRRFLPVALVLLLAPVVGRASDPTGIYAVVDKVVFEPSDSQPERIQVWGTFSLWKKYDDSSERWRVYTTPMRGVMRFSLTKKDAEQCRKEWADLKKVAGTGQCIAFGQRYTPNGAVAEEVDAKKDPIEYPLGNGMSKLESTAWISRELRAVPAPLSPEPRGAVSTKAVTLKVANATGKDFEKAKYIFEITSSTGQKETSAALDAGDKTTTWTPKLELKPDAKYTWTVRVEDDKFKGHPTTSTFQMKAKP